MLVGPSINLTMRFSFKLTGFIKVRIWALFCLFSKSSFFTPYLLLYTLLLD